MFLLLILSPLVSRIAILSSGRSIVVVVLSGIAKNKQLPIITSRGVCRRAVSLRAADCRHDRAHEVRRQIRSRNEKNLICCCCLANGVLKTKTELSRAACESNNNKRTYTKQNERTKQTQNKQNKLPKTEVGAVSAVRTAARRAAARLSSLPARAVIVTRTIPHIALPLYPRRLSHFSHRTIDECTGLRS
jgi:hypothetical protein